MEIVSINRKRIKFGTVDGKKDTVCIKNVKGRLSQLLEFYDNYFNDVESSLEIELTRGHKLTLSCFDGVFNFVLIDNNDREILNKFSEYEDEKSFQIIQNYLKMTEEADKLENYRIIAYKNDTELSVDNISAEIERISQYTRRTPKVDKKRNKSVKLNVRSDSDTTDTDN